MKLFSTDMIVLGE